MNKIITIKYNQSFRELQNKIIKNNNVVVHRCYDIHPYAKAPTFINCKTVFFNQCDKNMIYYWADLGTFPNVDNIYLLESHPCDLNVFCRFYNTGTKIYLSEEYSRYKDRWASRNSNVIVLSRNKMRELINTYVDENIITINRE